MFLLYLLLSILGLETIEAYGDEVYNDDLCGRASAVHVLQNKKSNGPYDDVNDVKKINSGRIVEEGAMPWAVSIKMERGYCSASLITKRHILTTAHCLFTKQECNADNLYNRITGAVAHVGARCVHNCGEQQLGEEIKIKEASLFEPYLWGKCSAVKDDVMVLELEEEVKHAHPVCLPWRHSKLREEYVYGVSDLVAAGYGEDPSVSADVIQLKSQNAGPMVPCRYDDGFTRYCIQKKANKGLCFGDSGGPITFVSHGDIHLLVAMSAGIDKTCSSNQEGKDIVMDVMYYEERITNAIKHGGPYEPVPLEE